MIKKAAILAGGKGTRLLPQTKIVNKHLLPIYTVHQGAIPMIWYPINTLISSGVKEILIVSSQEHCGDIIEFLGDGSQFGVDFSYKIQDHNDPKRPLGIASALSLCRSFFANENFAIILGDNFFENSFEKEFLEFSYKEDGCHLFLKEVEDLHRFGVAEIRNQRVCSITEKPKHIQKHENVFYAAVTGLYLYTPKVFSFVDQLVPSARGELEISDINDFYVKQQNAHFSLLSGYWSDMGTPPSLLKTQQWLNDTKFCVFKKT